MEKYFAIVQFIVVAAWIGAAMFYFQAAKKHKVSAFKWTFIGATIFIAAYYLANIVLSLALGIVMAGKTAEVQLQIVNAIQLLSAVIALVIAVYAKDKYLLDELTGKDQIDTTQKD